MTDCILIIARVTRHSLAVLRLSKHRALSALAVYSTLLTFSEKTCMTGLDRSSSFSGLLY